MSEYRYLLWDIDGTVLDFKLAEKNAIRTLFRKYGFGECSDEMIGRYSAINARYWQALERKEITKPEVLIGRFNEFFSLEGLDTSVTAAFNADYQLALGDTIAFCDDAMTILKELKGRYVLAAITNGTKIAQNKKLKKSGLEEVFDYIFISEEIGAEKPDPAFFEAAFKTMGISDTSGVLVIGDSLTSDILGGINAGVATCWYNPGHKAAREDIRPDTEIDDLHDICRILGEEKSL